MPASGIHRRNQRLQDALLVTKIDIKPLPTCCVPPKRCGVCPAYGMGNASMAGIRREVFRSPSRHFFVSDSRQNLNRVI